MKEEILHKISRCHLFEGLSRSELEALIRPESCRIREYHRNAVIAFRGDRYEDVWIILKGNITAQFEDYSGKVLKVETLSPTDPVASAILFAPDPVLPVTLTAAEEVELCVISRREVLAMMQRNSRFLLNYLQDSGLRLSVLAEKLRLIQFATIREKIASYILDLADKQSTDSPEIPVTRETLAEIFGVSRPSLSREFSHLSDEGCLRPEGRLVHILRREDLEEILKDE